VVQAQQDPIWPHTLSMGQALARNGRGTLYTTRVSVLQWKRSQHTRHWEGQSELGKEMMQQRMWGGAPSAGGQLAVIAGCRNVQGPWDGCARRRARHDMRGPARPGPGAGA
jgi:hypothetical protein